MRENARVTGELLCVRSYREPRDVTWPFRAFPISGHITECANKETGPHLTGARPLEGVDAHAQLEMEKVRAYDRLKYNPVPRPEQAQPLYRRHAKYTNATRGSETIKHTSARTASSSMARLTGGGSAKRVQKSRSLADGA